MVSARARYRRTATRVEGRADPKAKGLEILAASESLEVTLGRNAGIAHFPDGEKG